MLGAMTPLRRLRRAAIDVEPLRHAAFRRLWPGNSLGFIGFQLTAVAVPVQVYELTGSSFGVGMLGLAGLVPLVMFGLWGGAVADATARPARCSPEGLSAVGRRVIGGGCCTASGMSSAPLGRWSASAAGSTGSPHERPSRTPSLILIVQTFP